MDLRPLHKSIVRDMDAYGFGDDQWMKSRIDMKEKPLNIYELHMGSWRKKTDEADGWYRYDELAKPLIDYLNMHRIVRCCCTVSGRNLEERLCRKKRSVP